MSSTRPTTMMKLHMMSKGSDMEALAVKLLKPKGLPPVTPNWLTSMPRELGSMTLPALS